MWWGFILLKEEPCRRGKNRLYVQLAQSKSNHSSQLLDKASPRFPRQVDLKTVASRMRGQRQRAELPSQGNVLQLRGHRVDWSSRWADPLAAAEGETWTKPSLYGRNPFPLTQAGIKSASLASPSHSTGTATTMAGLTFGGPGTVEVSTELQLSQSPLLQVSIS